MRVLFDGAPLEDGEFGLRFLHRGVEQRQLEADLVDLDAVRPEVLLRESQRLDVFPPGELHTVGFAMSLGGGEAVLEFGQFGIFALF